MGARGFTRQVLRGLAIAIAVVGGVTALGCFSASATPVTWTISGVTGQDGTQVTGTFVYNANTNIFSDLAMTTTGGSTVPATSSWVFMPGQESNQFNSVRFAALDSLSADETGAHIVSFDSSGTIMTNQGGTIVLELVETGTCADSDCSTITGVSGCHCGEFIANPSAAVPEPITLSLFGAGLVGAVAMRRRKSTN